ncbi:hypothetical protein MPSEU_000813600 [Mayamaea pseudoterrestris]|nr:hypothetical protein MPSEU_000813600 [Mayamaea pseudoterrestris]
MNDTSIDPFSLIERSIAARSPDVQPKPRVASSVTRKKKTNTKKRDDASTVSTSETTRPLGDDGDESIKLELQSFFHASPKSNKGKRTQHVVAATKSSSTSPASARSTVTTTISTDGTSSNTSDLSELAKQLRLLQTKNDAQTIEMTRLERQLQIMADVSNVSVHDLRAALLSACAAQAPSELQASLASLRNQLQLAQLQLQQQQQQQQGDGFVRRHNEAADYQLRIGELEEIEEEQRQELKVLYNDLREQSASWIRLRAQYEEQQALLEEYKRREEEGASLKEKDGQITKNDDPENDDDMQQEEERLEASEQLLREELELASDLGGLLSSPRSTEDQTATATVEEQVEQGQLVIVQKQLAESEKNYKLKQEQLKARNFVLEEHVQDLEQQLSSLYMAFNITSQDLEQEQQARRALELNLHAADERVAQYLDTTTKSENAKKVSKSHSVAQAGDDESSERFGPAQHSPQRLPTPQRHGTSQRQLVSPPLTSSPSPVPRLEQPGDFSPTQSTRELLLEGNLLLRTTGMRRTWKEKHAALYLSSTQFYLVLSNPGERWNAKTFKAATGSAELQTYRKQPFAFTLLIAPGDNSAVVLYLGATSETDFTNWMNALGSVSSHPDPLSGDHMDDATSVSRETSPEMTPDVASQEAADLERAILLSTREQHVHSYC